MSDLSDFSRTKERKIKPLWVRGSRNRDMVKLVPTPREQRYVVPVSWHIEEGPTTSSRTSGQLEAKEKKERPSKRSVEDQEVVGPSRKKPAPPSNPAPACGPSFGPTRPVTSSFGWYKIPKKGPKKEPKVEQPPADPQPPPTQPTLRTVHSEDEVFRTFQDDPTFPSTAAIHMAVSIYTALKEAEEVKGHTLFLFEEPLQFLNPDLLKTAGTVLCKFNGLYRPHLLPCVLSGISKDLSKGIDNVFITMTHNALMSRMANKHRWQIPEAIGSKKPIASIYDNFKEIVESLVDGFGVKRVAIIIPPSGADVETLQKLRNGFTQALKKDRYLYEHVFLADFAMYSMFHDVKSTQDGLQQFLRDTVGAYVGMREIEDE